LKLCPDCASEIVGEQWVCVSCNWRAPVERGIALISRVPDGRREGYDPIYFDQLAALEEGNFWFRARNGLIESLARSHVPPRARYLEIGCGTGFVLRHMRRQFTQWTVSASELHFAGLLQASRRTPEGVRFMQLDATSLPFRAEFDLIGAFDVIEHIEEDEAVLREMHRALRPGGLVMLTVPQHMWLWSRYDEAGGHVRRYSRAGLRQRLRDAGFTIVREASFNSVLVPAMLLSRMISFGRRRADVDALQELRIPPLLNALLYWLLRAEVVVTTTLRVDWPVGGSRIVLARKAGDAPPG
jgi:SAM-dependent methyltransferase